MEQESERKKRLEALRPDAAIVANFARMLHSLEVPLVQSPAAQEVIDEAFVLIEQAADLADGINVEE